MIKGQVDKNGHLTFETDDIKALQEIMRHVNRVEQPVAIKSTKTTSPITCTAWTEPEILKLADALEAADTSVRSPVEAVTKSVAPQMSGRTEYAVYNMVYRMFQYLKGVKAGRTLSKKTQKSLERNNYNFGCLKSMSKSTETPKTQPQGNSLLYRARDLVTQEA